MYTYSSALQNVDSTYNSSKDEMSDIKEFLQNFSNEITSIKQKNSMPAKSTFQNYQGGRPSYQKNQFQGGEHMNPLTQTNNQIVLVPTLLQNIHLSSNRELVVGKNNLTNDTNPWCFPCNKAHIP